MKTWARPGMETLQNGNINVYDGDGDEDYEDVQTRKTMAIFSSCHRPTSPKLQYDLGLHLSRFKYVFVAPPISPIIWSNVFSFSTHPFCLMYIFRSLGCSRAHFRSLISVVFSRFSIFSTLGPPRSAGYCTLYRLFMTSWKFYCPKAQTHQVAETQFRLRQSQNIEMSSSPGKASPNLYKHIIVMKTQGLC